MQDVTRKVAGYEIVRVIGRGGMAVVYLARQTDLDRFVALKELSAFHATDPSWAKRFLGESRIAGSLTHPNIVTVHDYVEHDGVPYIAMEYMERGSLRPFVGHLTLARIGIVLESMLAGLALAHSKQIVHRDLKPENLMISGDGAVKIADFGIAKALHEPTTLRTLTATGMTVGTPAYMAPEQAMAKQIGPWTDLYATGVIAYELLAGHVPFRETETPWAVLHSQIYDPPPPLLEQDPDLDPRLVEWVDRLLAKQPRDRPRTATQAWHEVEDILVGVLGPRWRREARLPKEPPPGERMTATKMTRVATLTGQEQEEEELPPAPGLEDEDVTVVVPPPVVEPAPVAAAVAPPQPEPVPGPVPAEPEPVAAAAAVEAPAPAAAAPEPAPAPAAPSADDSFAFPAPRVRLGLRSRSRLLWLLGALALAAAGAIAIAVLTLGGGGKAGAARTSTQAPLPPDPAPSPAEQLGLAASGSSAWVAAPNGRLVRLSGRGLAIGPILRDPAGPRAVAVAGDTVAVLDGETLSFLRRDTLVQVASVPFAGGTFLAGGRGLPLVVASDHNVCPVHGHALGPCTTLGVHVTGLGVAPSGSAFVADASGDDIVSMRPADGALHPQGSFSLPAGSRPHGTLVVYRGSIYVPVRRGIAVIDATKGTVTRTIRLPTTPQGLWIARLNGRLFAALYASDRVAVLDLTSPGATPKLVDAGKGPVAVASSVGGTVVYVAGGGSVALLDAVSGQTLRSASVTPLTAARLQALVVGSISFRKAGRTVMARIRFAGGAFDGGTLVMNDNAIADGHASFVLVQGGIGTKLTLASTAGLTIRLTRTPGRLVVTLSAPARHFLSFGVRPVAGGRALVLVLRVRPPATPTTTSQSGPTTTFQPPQTQPPPPPTRPPPTSTGTTTVS